MPCAFATATLGAGRRGEGFQNLCLVALRLFLGEPCLVRLQLPDTLSAYFSEMRGSVYQEPPLVCLQVPDTLGAGFKEMNLGSLMGDMQVLEEPCLVCLQLPSFRSFRNHSLWLCNS